jgi:hypothetical protein
MCTSYTAFDSPHSVPILAPTRRFAGRLPGAVLLEDVVLVLVAHGTPPEAHLAQVVARTARDRKSLLSDSLYEWPRVIC